MSFKRISLYVAFLIILTAGSLAFSAEPNQTQDKTSALEKENTQLRSRVDTLEKKVDELSKIVTPKPQPAQPIRVAATPANQPKLSNEDVNKILANLKKEETKKNVFSSLDVELYGIFKLDSSWDSARMNSGGNFADWVKSQAIEKRDSEFTMTPKQTRFGIRVFGPPKDDFKTSAVAEIDFYGTDAGENKAAILLRHAYIQLDWPKERFSILAGQTSDLISPLYPSTINYTVGWWVGNIGYRRPQIRFTKIYALNKDVDWTIAGAFTRTIKNDIFFTTDTGKDSGLPGLQGRTALKFPFFGDKPTEVGFSTHWSKELYDTDSAPDRTFYSYSYNIDVTQPVNSWLAFKGEAFTGQNLAAYLGGIGQGVNTTTNKEISSKGGWIAASLGPWDKWSFNIGGGMDTAERDDLSIGGRTLNHNVFGNAIYSIDKNAKVGLELSHWRTEYKGPGDGESFRAQMAFMYYF